MRDGQTLLQGWIVDLPLVFASGEVGLILLVLREGMCFGAVGTSKMLLGFLLLRGSVP